MNAPEAPLAEELQLLIQYRLLTELLEKERDLAESQRTAHLGSWTRHVQEGISVWSDELYRLLRLPPSTPASLEVFLAQVHPDDRDRVRREIDLSERDGGPFDLLFRSARTDVTLWFRARGAVSLEPDGSQRSHGTLQDLSDQVESAASLALLTRQRSAMALLARADLLVLYDPEGVPLLSSGREPDLAAGWVPGVLLGDEAPVHPDDVARLRTAQEELLQTPGRRLRCRYRLAQGDGWRTVDSYAINAVDDPMIRGICVAFSASDLEAVGRREQRHQGGALPRLNEHNGLLGVAKVILARAVEHGWRSAFLVIDVDGFQQVNERWGAANGDLVLMQLATRLQETFGASDASAEAMPGGRGYVTHLGGDRFVVVCENVPDAEAARATAERLQTVVAAPFALPEGGEVRISVGIGIAITPPSGRSAEHRLRDAEAALRSAKELGPAHYVVLAEGAISHREMERKDEQALRRALDNGELVLHYQPKLSLESQRITGVEALLRWEDPGRGLIPPLEFIPQAEQSGLIIPMGRWVIEQACRQLSEWQRLLPRQPPLVMAVNVSAPQFTPELVGIVSAALQASGAQASQLCVEITESMLIADAEASGATLRSLARLGVKLSIDDFGTGFSSLAYLKRFPLHELKIDKTFVDGLGLEDGDTAIIGATIAMAHALGLSVIAEGVETADQLERLRVLGCQEVQGYLIAKPQPPHVATAFLTAETASGWRAATAGSGVEGSAAFRAPRVLVVDDADDVRQLARMSLTAAGFDVHEADDGARALDLAKRLLPDCVILDVSMPGMSGLQVCRALRADPVTAGCRILMLTAKDQATDKIEAFAGGADDYIVKPFAPRDLVVRVQAALRRDGSAAR